MASGKRFEVIVNERSSMNGHTRTVKDKQTGALYIYHGSSNGGGLTPLLGSDGKPMIDPVKK